MWPLVIGAGALWYLTRLRRNPDWITDAQGRHHPLRAGDGRAGDPTPYDPAKVGEKGPRRAVSPATAPPAEVARTRSGARAQPTAQALSGPSWRPSNYYSDVWRAEYPSDEGFIEGVRVLVQRANVSVPEDMQYVAWRSIRAVQSGKVLKDFGDEWKGERYAATKAEAIEKAKELARESGGQLVRKADESALVRSRRERLSGADVKRAAALQARREAAKPRGLSGPAWEPREGAREVWRHEYKGTRGAPTYRGIVYYLDTPDALGREYAAVYGAEVRPGVYAYTSGDSGRSLAEMRESIETGVAIGQRMDRARAEQQRVKAANEAVRTAVDPGGARREKLFAEIDRVWDAVGRSDIVAIGPSRTHERTRQAIRRAIRENKVPMALRADVESQLMAKAEPYIRNQIEVGVTPTRSARRR